jgi:radical SAM/Cys-rich protein
MNLFEKEVIKNTGDLLHSFEIEILQLNLGLRCNQQCAHCHLEASPSRKEAMDWPTMELVLKAAAKASCRIVDLTGGAPELNPYFRPFVQALCQAGHQVQVRTNLTVLLEPSLGDLPRFLRDHRIKLVASLPCYFEENVRAQRGRGVYEKSIEAIKRLNALGYGCQDDLPLNLVYNPGGPFLPPQQLGLEEDYRHELGTRFGVKFSHLLTITNMPLGRFRGQLIGRKEEESYGRLLQESFNPQTLEGLMCRHQVSVGWDGRLYDCDFNLALGLPVNHGAPDHIECFRPADLVRRRIVTAEHCFGCTAGAGSSCRGALA